MMRALHRMRTQGRYAATSALARWDFGFRPFPAERLVAPAR